MCLTTRVNKCTWNTEIHVWKTPASNGRGENSVRTMKEMVQRQKDAVFSLGIESSIKHPRFALLVRHSEFGAQ